MRNGNGPDTDWRDGGDAKRRRPFFDDGWQEAQIHSALEGLMGGVWTPVGAPPWPAAPG